MLPLMDRWDVALLAVAAYIAAVSLVRLMAYRRAKLVAQFRAEVALAHHRQAELARQQKRSAKTQQPQRQPQPKTAGGRGAA